MRKRSKSVEFYSDELRKKLKKLFPRRWYCFEYPHRRLYGTDSSLVLETFRFTGESTFLRYAAFKIGLTAITNRPRYSRSIHSLVSKKNYESRSNYRECGIVCRSVSQKCSTRGLLIGLFHRVGKFFENTLGALLTGFPHFGRVFQELGTITVEYIIKGNGRPNTRYHRSRIHYYDKIDQTLDPIHYLDA